MTTVAVYAAQMKGQGVSDDDIVQQLRQQTGKHKPGPNDEVPGTPPSQPLSQGNGQPEGLGMAAPTPQGLTGQGSGPTPRDMFNEQVRQDVQPNVMPMLGGEMQSSMASGREGARMQQDVGQPGPSRNQQMQQYAQANQPPPPAPPQPGLLSQMGDGLKSMGQGMSGYMGKLFDDPNRMALLQGGLSMMDPNSYYDKQGFGSVFTGLNKGFGAAQGGMQGVLDRRKSRAETAQLHQGGKSTYKTITETNKQGNPVQVNYKIDAHGNKTEESRSDVRKMVFGMNEKTGEMMVQDYNQTTNSLKPVAVKATDFTPAEIQQSVNMLNELQTWEDLLKANPISASEFPGKAASWVNWLSESLGGGTAFGGRAKIDTMIAQLKPMLTPEILKDSRISEGEWELVNAALGMGEWSSGMAKERAIPAIRKIIRIRAGLPLESGGDDAPSSGGYKAGDVQNAPWKRKTQ